MNEKTPQHYMQMKFKVNGDQNQISGATQEMEKLKADPSCIHQHDLVDCERMMMITLQALRVDIVTISDVDWLKVRMIDLIRSKFDETHFLI